MTKLLLVDLDKDYIRQTENSSDFRLKHDLFSEALDNLEDDIRGWTASAGIELKLECVNETVEKIQCQEGTITRMHTRVYAITESDDDVAWINLSLGKIKPSTILSRGQSRGWQFVWDTGN